MESGSGIRAGSGGAGVPEESAREWLVVAVGSLIVAGLLALALVIGRLPGLAPALDPLFFRRCLVVHVNLALVVWFYAFVAALFRFLPAPAGARPGASRLGRASAVVGALGALLFTAAGAIPGAAPVLSNYIPMIDHPLFAAGLLLFGVAVAASFLDRRFLPAADGGALLRGVLPAPAEVGVRAAALAFLLALLTFLAGWFATPSWLGAEAYYESLFWGGGHVLQFASVAGMLACWAVLVAHATGRSPMSRRTASLLFGLLVAPLLFAPLLAWRGTTEGYVREGFTRLMQFGIFPVVLVFLALCGRALLAARREGRLGPRGLLSAPLVAFHGSVLLALLGFVLGALIRGPSTLIPAHYHASIGAVTAAFMGTAWALRAPFGLRLESARVRALAAVQPAIFAVGQAVFALGFGLAGAAGMGRKIYGAEQHVRSATEWTGLALVGVGGLVAVLGGLVFIGIFIHSLRASRAAPPDLTEGRPAWPPTRESIPSRS